MNPLKGVFAISIVAFLMVFLSCDKGDDNQMNAMLLAVAGGNSHQSTSSGPGKASLALSLPGHSSDSTRALQDVSSVTLEINADDMSSPMIVDLTYSDGEWGGVVEDIPSGSDRTFIVKAYDMSDILLYEGSATNVTIDSGNTALVYILLEDMIPAEPFENVAPIIDAFALTSGTVVPDGELVVAVSAHDENEGDILSYQWSSTGGYFTDENNSISYWYAPATTGSYSITIIVSDNAGSMATMNINVNVDDGVGDAEVSTEFNTYPAVTNVTADPTLIDVNETTSLNVVATDGDNDTLSYQWISNCGGNFDNNTIQTPVFTAPASYPADNQCKLTVEVNDGRGGVTSGSLTMHIGNPVPVNLVPVIESYSQTAAEVELYETVTFYVEASDPENQSLSFTWYATGGGVLGTPQDTATSSQVEFSTGLAGEFTIIAVVQDDGIVHAEQIFNVTVNPAYTESILIGSDTVRGHSFGRSVWIDGDRAIVGANAYPDYHNLGAAYIFEKDSVTGNWNEAIKLTASDPEYNDNFGLSVSLSGDFAIVGAKYEDGAGTNRGSVYVFQRDSVTGNWNEVAKLSASDAEDDDQFGYVISINGDSIIVGTPYEDGAGTNYGAAYIFERDSGTGNWNEVAKLVDPEPVNSNYYGSTVSISGDYAIVGNRKENCPAADCGAAYIYKRDSGTGNWSETARITASDESYMDMFGVSVFINGDRVIVGADRKDEGGSDRGAAYVFERESGTENWIETTKLIASDGQDIDYFGRYVSLDGDRAVIGATHVDVVGSNSGAAYIFERDAVSGTWSEKAKLNSYYAEESDMFGIGVGISGDTVIVASQYGQVPDIYNSGAAYIFEPIIE